jgi:hypothetical protein
MRTETRLLFGPIAAVVFFFGVLGLSLLIPGYSHVHQDISPIGKLGSPLRVPFSIVLISYACSLLFFASGVFNVAGHAGTSRLPAYLVAFMAFTQIGVAIFATPHPLHNMFGIASMAGFLAPLAMAVGWKRDRSARTLVVASYVLGFLVLGSLIVGLSELDPQSQLWQLVKSGPGLVQRSLAAAWLTWLLCQEFSYVDGNPCQRNRASISFETTKVELGIMSPELEDAGALSEQDQSRELQSSLCFRRLT